MRNETTSDTSATAAAPAKSYCSSRVTMISGTISVLPGMLPAIKMTEPYSPSVRASASAKPVRNAGATSGSVTRRKIVNGAAPSDAAACANSRGSVAITGCTVRTTNGSPTKASASTIPAGVYAIAMPCCASHEPTQPCGP